MNVEFTEQLFEAIDTLIRKSQEQQNIYDRTIVGKVLLIDQNGTRFYIEDQSTRFYARGPADSAKYKANDQVYVLLPQGNYNNSVVVGKYNADDERAITYRGELDSVIDMTGNIFEPLDNLWQLDLRTPKVKEERFYKEIKEEIKLNNSGSLTSFGSFDYGIKDKKGFDYICLSAEIQTGDTLTIENQNGNYGLYFQVKFEKTGDLWYDFIFDSSQMIGNPYMYVGDFYRQSIVYKSDPTHGYPTDIKCILYAKDNFDFDGQVKIKNISCSFGYAQTDFSEDDILALYLKEGTKLYNNNNNDEQKTLGIKWLHHNNSTGLMECYDSLRPAPIEVQYLVLKPEQLSSVKELTGLTNEELKEIQEVCKEYYNTLAQIEEAKENNEPIEELEEKKVSYLNQILEKQQFYETTLAMPTNLNWYLYRPGETIDIGAGVYWGQLVNGEADNYSNYSEYDYLLGQNKYIKLQATDESDIVHSSIDLPVFDNMSTQFNVQIDTGKIESYEEEIEKTNDEGKITKEKVTYLRMVENKLVSDNFEFQSAEPRVDAVTSSYVKELMITCAQGTTFNIYGNDNKLYSSARRNLDLTVQYTNNKAISAAANIFWLIPKKSTMIQEPKEDEYLSNSSSWWNILGTEITNKYYIIQEQGKGSTILTRTFNLKTSYNPVSNNYIECRIYEGQSDYKSGIISFNIGSTNNQNTEFSFNIVVDSYMVDLEEQSSGNKKENIPVSRHIFTNDITGLLKLIGYPEGYSIISKKIIFKTELRNSKGELIAQDTPKWSYSDNGINWSTEEENEILTLNADTTSCKIIKASTTITNTNNKNVNLVSYYLLPYTSELAYDLTDGDFNIIYNQFKTFPSGDTKYILYKNDIIQTSEDVDSAITNNYDNIIKSSWVIKKDKNNKEVPSEEYEIKLPGTPFQEGTIFTILEYKINNTKIYQQPIRIDSLTISNFANWNGEIYISGTGENAISMAPTFAAGSIDENNNFTGVSMGKFQAGSNLAEGLYGFQKGEKVFVLDTNGNVDINATNLRIEATKNKNTLLIDSMAVGTNFPILQATKEGNIIFSLSGNGNNNKIGGWLISDKDLTSNGGKTGMSTGTGAKWAFWAGKTEKEKEQDDDDANFYVNHNGELHVKNAIIELNYTEGENTFTGRMGKKNHLLGIYLQGDLESVYGASGTINIGLNSSSKLTNNQGIFICENMPGGLFISNQSNSSNLDNWDTGMLEIRSQQIGKDYYPVILLQETKSQGFGFFIGFKHTDPKSSGQVWYTGYGGTMTNDGTYAYAGPITESDDPFPSS